MEFVHFQVKMEQWKQRKEQELQQVREQTLKTREKIANVKRQIAETRKVIDAQPLSKEDIRKMRAESKSEFQAVEMHV